MSIEAINWALNHAPEFADEDPRQRPHLALVLIGLANHADPAGRNAFPSIETLCRYTRLSESTVRRCLHRLVELGVIRPGDPELQQFYIRRQDRRPMVYDLVMDGGSPAPGAVDNPDDGVSYGTGHGVSHRPNGVSERAARGVIPAGKRPGMTPEPSLNHPGSRPARERAPEARSPLPPLCGHCDARPGDPVSARVVWLDTSRTRSTRCPRCHPAAGSPQPVPVPAGAPGTAPQPGPPAPVIGHRPPPARRTARRRGARRCA